MAFEWIAENLDSSRFDLSFILLNYGYSELESFLQKQGMKTIRINYSSKKDIPLAMAKTLFFLYKNKTETIHTHLFEATFIGLIAAKLLGIKKRIYTRHHSKYNHVYFPNAVKWDKLNNYLATDIIAISENVSKILQHNEKVPPKKITIVNHGFMLKQFDTPSNTSIEKIYEKYNLKNKKPIIGVISRFIELKGIQYIIPAFKKILSDYPNALLLLANAEGDYKNEIKKLLNSIPEKNYLEIEFEPDIFALYKLFDIFIHVPIDREIEAFGQTYVESLAAGIPSIFTLSGIANEFIKDNENAIVVPYKNSEKIYEAMIKIISEPEVAKKIAEQGKKDVLRKFELQNMISALEKIYEK